MRQHTVPTPYPVGDVHLYSTEVRGEIVLFDTGPPTPQALDYLRRNIDLKQLRHLLVTHCHVDHYGLAEYIASHTEAEIYLPRKDAMKFRHHQQRMAGIESLLEEFGFDRGFSRHFRESIARNQVFPAIPHRFRLVEESGDEFSRLGIRYRSCPGHSQSDLIYLCGDHAICGDVLLRGIFQAPLLDLDLETLDGRFRNYHAYCRSLIELGKLRGCEILPGHRESVDSLEETILFYVGKLLERARRLQNHSPREAISSVVRTLFGDKGADPFVIYLKVSEIVFMRDFLADPVRLQQSLQRIGLYEEVRPAFEAAAA